MAFLAKNPAYRVDAPVPKGSIRKTITDPFIGKGSLEEIVPKRFRVRLHTSRRGEKPIIQGIIVCR